MMAENGRTASYDRDWHGMWIGIQISPSARSRSPPLHCGNRGAGEGEPIFPHMLFAVIECGCIFLAGEFPCSDVLV
jgi:hypothetical protein